MKENVKVYFPNLDGLRFLAFLSVFISHAALFFGFQNGSPFFAKFKQLFLVQGDLGVNFFFVLSGFLITYLLFQERKNTGIIQLSHFYMRRITRIWPVYFIVIVVGFFIIPFVSAAVGGGFPFSTAVHFSQLPWYLFFTANIAMSFYAAPSVIIAVLWSISVEEQFYLLWPLLLKKTSARTLGYSICSIILISFVGRLFFAYNIDVSQYFTISVMSALAVGAGLAFCVEYLPAVKEKLAHLSRASIILIYVLIFCLIPFKGAVPGLFSDGWYRFIYALVPLVFSILFALVIAEQNYSEHSIYKIGEQKVLTSLGKISYGLYAYHLIAVFAVLTLLKIIGVSTAYTSITLYIVVILFSFALTVILSHLSYAFIEKRFLKLKERFAR